MAKTKDRRALAQNFLRSSGPVRSLLEASSIGPRDIAYEIGPGRGIITAELARVARWVIAIEKDPDLARGLSSFANQKTSLRLDPAGGRFPLSPVRSLWFLHLEK